MSGELDGFPTPLQLRKPFSTFPQFFSRELQLIQVRSDSSLIAQGSLEASKAMWIGQTQLNYQEGVSCIASIGLNKLKK
jgi:hypothetical protein